MMLKPLLLGGLIGLFGMTGLTGAAQAGLPDPTRPPAGLVPAPAASSPTPRPAAALPLPPAAVAMPVPAQPLPVRAVLPPPPPRPALRLQSLHRPASGEPSALIDGRLLHIGDRVGDATLAEIRADGVLLRLPGGGMQWLGLLAPMPSQAAPTMPASPIPTPFPATKPNTLTADTARKEP